MLTEKQVNKIRDELDTCKKPLFFFHDDADGLASFLLLYRYVREGKGIIIKTSPRVDAKFIKQVEEYDPDKIFVLDLAMVDQEFIDAVKKPIIWIDHHTPLDRDRIQYFNPRIANPDNNVPASVLCHQVVQQDLWIAAMGAVGDWYWPDFADEFKKKFPALLNKDINDPETALFESDIGKLVSISQFCLKGTAVDAMKYVKIFTRIDSPEEILDQTTSAGKYIFRRFQMMDTYYQKLLKEALEKEPTGKILVFDYPHDRYSFTKDLANELLHRKPDFIIIIARESQGEVKMSLRSKHYLLPPILEKALVGVEGYGGGHEHACGANVKKEFFEQFIYAISSQIS